MVAFGLALMSSGFVVATVTPLDASYWTWIIGAMTMMAAGLAFTTGPATEAIMGALPPAKAGAGSAVNDTTGEVGGTLGVAIVGSVPNSAYGSHVVTALTGLGAPASAAHFLAQLQGAAAEAVQQAFMAGVHRGSLVAAAAAAAGALVALVLVPSRAAGAASPSRTDPAVSRTRRVAATTM